MVKILLCGHSKQRLKARKIRIRDVRMAVQNITSTVPAKKKGRHKICGAVSGKLLWVIYETRKKNSYFIITSYWA